MIKRRVIVVAVISALALATGCGDTSPSEADKRRQNDAENAAALRRVKAQEAADAKAAQQRKLAAAQQAKTECAAEFGALLRALGNLRSRLDVGLSYSDYTTRVGSVHVRYDEVDLASVTNDRCLSHVGVPAESAMNHYISAAQRWNRCVADAACSTDSIDAYLQREWAAAGKNVERARTGLSRMSIPT